MRLDQAEDDWVNHNEKDKSRGSFREKIELQGGVKFSEAQRRAIHAFLFSGRRGEIHGHA